MVVADKDGGGQDRECGEDGGGCDWPHLSSGGGENAGWLQERKRVSGKERERQRGRRRGITKLPFKFTAKLLFCLWCYICVKNYMFT